MLNLIFGLVCMVVGAMNLVIWIDDVRPPQKMEVDPINITIMEKGVFKNRITTSRDITVDYRGNAEIEWNK